MRPSNEYFVTLIKCVSQLFYFFVIQLPFYYGEIFYKIIFPEVPKPVKGEIVLITGTGHGIGKLLALKYAREGATVVGWDINEKNNENTVKEIKESGYSKVHGYKCDVSNRDDVLAVAKKVQEELGDVTILINNAGIMPTHSFLEHTPQEIKRLIDINVSAHFWTLEAFLPSMKRNNHGHVVCLSSMAGLLGLVNLAPYNATKYAVRGLMEGLYEEYRRYPNNQVYFTTIYPFMVDTGLCKRPDIAFDFMAPLLKPEFVAEEIFKAQTNNKRNVSVPKDIGVLLNVRSLWPQNAVNYFSDTFKADLKSDLEQK